MKTAKGKASQYNMVCSKAILRYIEEYSKTVSDWVAQAGKEWAENGNVPMNRTDLKTLAATMETASNIIKK